MGIGSLVYANQDGGKIVVGRDAGKIGELWEIFSACRSNFGILILSWRIGVRERATQRCRFLGGRLKGRLVSPDTREILNQINRGAAGQERVSRR